VQIEGQLIPMVGELQKVIKVIKVMINAKDGVDDFCSNFKRMVEDKDVTFSSDKVKDMMLSQVDKVLRDIAPLKG